MLRARAADVEDALIRTSILTLSQKVGHDREVAEQEQISNGKNQSQVDLAAETLATLSGREIVEALRKASLSTRQVSAVRTWTEGTRSDSRAKAKGKSPSTSELPVSDDTIMRQRKSLAELLECKRVPEWKRFESLLTDIADIQIRDNKVKDLLVRRLKALATLCDVELLYEGLPVRSITSSYRGRGTGSFDFRTDDPTVSYRKSAFPKLGVRPK